MTALPRTGWTALYVEVDGQWLPAEARDRPDGTRVYVARDGEDVRVFALRGREPWPEVVEVTDDEAERPARARLVAARDTAERIAHLRRTQAMGPLDWQRQHGEFEKELTTVSYNTPTEDGQGLVEVTERAYARKRKMDSRIWDALTDAQRRAAEQIEDGYRGLTAGLGERGMPWGERSGAAKGQGLERRHIPGLERVEAYWDWAQAARYLGISVAAVIAMICDGASARQVDRRHGRRKGWARDNLESALDLYLDQRRIGAILAGARERRDP